MFSTLKKELNDVFTFAIDESFVLVSFEIPWEPTAALYEFSMYGWFKEWCSTISRYRFVSTPGTFASFISRKTWVQLADLPKVRCERSVFSAPRQRMSVVEGREVIVINIKKIRQVISELSIYFFPTEHPDSVRPQPVPWQLTVTGQWPEVTGKWPDWCPWATQLKTKTIYEYCGSLCLFWLVCAKGFCHFSIMNLWHPSISRDFVFRHELPRVVYQYI